MTFRLVTIFNLATLIGLSAHAAERSLTLAEALARTLRQSPELAAFSWEVRAAEAKIIQAKLRPNPEVSVQAENFVGSGDFKNGTEAERTLQLSQLIELGGKRESRVAEAEAGRKVAEWEYQVKRVEVLKETSQAFVDVLVGQKLVELAEQTLEVAEAATPVTAQRVQVGKASQVEVTRSNIAVASARIEVEQARRTLAIARGKLAAQWGGRRADFDAVVGDLDRLEHTPKLSELSAKLMRNPQLARWTAERERRRAALALAQAQGRPDVTISGGPRVEGKADDITAVAGVSLPLPLWNRNQGAVKEARANIAKAEEEQRAAEAKAFQALDEAYNTLVRAAGEIEILERDVLPGAAEAEKMTLSGYEQGRFAQLEIFEARRTLLTSRTQNLRAHADYHKAMAEIEALTAAPVRLPTATTRSK